MWIKWGRRQQSRDRSSTRGLLKVEADTLDSARRRLELRFYSIFTQILFDGGARQTGMSGNLSYWHFVTQYPASHNTQKSRIDHSKSRWTKTIASFIECTDPFVFCFRYAFLWGKGQTICYHSFASIQTAIPIIIRFSVSDTNPKGTLLSPPTQAHLSSRLSM